MTHNNEKSSTLIEDVAKQLRIMVHAGEVLPGGRFPPERELAEKLSVSRMTLREGLKLLRSEGYLEVKRGPYGGAYVTDLQLPAEEWLNRMREDPSAIDEVFDFRVGVETAAAYFAALRRDTQDLEDIADAISDMSAATTRGEFRYQDSRFHERVSVAARSRRLNQAVRQLRSEVFSPMDLLGIPTSPQDDAEHHSLVLEAIRQSNSDVAAARMRAHLEHTREHLRRLLGAPPNQLTRHINRKLPSDRP